MKRKKLAICILILILVLCSNTQSIIAYGNSQLSNENLALDRGEYTNNEGKIEIINLHNKNVMTKGVVIQEGDLDEWEFNVEGWEIIFSHVMAGDKDNEHWVYLELEELLLQEVDLNKAGTYKVTAKLKLKEQFENEYYISDKNRTLEIPVYICKKDELFIGHTATTSTNIEFQWVNNIEWPNPSIWYAEEINDGDKENHIPPKEEDEWTLYEEIDGDLIAGGGIFRIHRTFLDKEKVYYFKLQIDDITSNIVRVYGDTAEVIDDGTGGDRDPSDPDGGNPPDIVQPPPPIKPEPEIPEPPTDLIPPIKPEPPVDPDVKPPVTDDKDNEEEEDSNKEEEDGDSEEDNSNDENSNESSTNSSNDNNSNKEEIKDVESNKEDEEDEFVEVFSKTKDIISGTRLLRMMDESETVQFSKLGLTIYLQTKELEKLNVVDSDKFEVTINPYKNDKFILILKLNDKEITNVVNTKVMVEYKLNKENARLTLINSNNEVASQGEYDLNLGVATFYVDETGEYTILEDDTYEVATAVKVNNSSKLKVLIITVSVMIISTIGVLYSKKRKSRE